MALQTFPTNELIRLYETVLASIRTRDGDALGESRRLRLVAISAELDKRSTYIVRDLYQSIAS